MIKVGFINDKLGFALGFLCVLLFTGFGIWWVLQPSWQPILNSQNSPESRVEIRNHLMAWAIPFREDEASGNILVQESDLLVIRTKLGQLGIPEEPSPGLEIFSEAEYGMSEFTQRINYQRAMEGEISQTIRSFADVISARVHLTIPKKSIFRDEKVLPKASVTIKPRSGQRLSRTQINGISELVAASVEGLKPESVIVLNDKGEVVSGHEDEKGANAQQSKYDLESYYAQKAFKLVQGITRTNDIKVSVSIAYNSDKIKSVKEKFLPNSDGQIGHLIKSKRQTTESAGEDGADASSNIIVDEEYVFSTERSEIEYASGEIERLSVGIVVMKAIPESAIEDIINVVNSGLGIDPARGDDLAVVAVAPRYKADDQIGEVQNDDKLPGVLQPLKALPANQWLPQIERIYIVIGFVAFFAFIAAFTMLVAMRLKRRPQADLARLSQDEQEVLLLDLKEWLSRSPADGSSNA